MSIKERHLGKLGIIVLSMLLVACSTKTISTTPVTNLKLVGDTVMVNVTGQDIDAGMLEQLTREIKGRLIIAGFDVDKETDKKINLKVLVAAFTPGNAALRLTVGFGAGRGSLLYVAEYTDKSGQTLAKMEGRERFTGTEVGFNQNYGGLHNPGRRGNFYNRSNQGSGKAHSRACPKAINSGNFLAGVG